MRATHWIWDVCDAPDPVRVADHITAARAVNAVLLERQQRHGVTAGAAAGQVMQAHSAVEVTGYGEAFSGEIVDARAARLRHVQGSPLGIDQVGDLLQLRDAQRSLLRSNRDVMVQAAARFFTDRQRLTWQDLQAMPVRDLYVLMEQGGNPERPVRNPIALSYQGEAGYHPYIGCGVVGAYRVDGDVVTVRTRAHPAAAVGSDLVVHPQSKGAFGHLTAAPWKDLRPTTSVRTLYDPVEDRHYKASFDAQITSHTRLLHRHEAANAVAATNLLLTIAERGLLPEGVHFLPELAWLSHRSSDVANCLLRGGLGDMIPPVPPGAHVIAMSSLATPLSFTGNRTFVEIMACRHPSPVALFRQIAEALIRGHLGLVELGISHETHAQNTLLVVDLENVHVHGICLRDVEAMKIDPCRHAELGLPTFHRDGTAQTRSQAVLDPATPEVRRYLLTASFTHSILDSQLSCLAKVLLDTRILSLAEIVDVTRRAIQQCRADLGYVRLNLLASYYRRNLAHKGLGLPISQPYRRIDNVLFP